MAMGGSGTGIGTAGPDVDIPGGGEEGEFALCTNCNSQVYSFIRGGMCNENTFSFINRGEGSYSYRGQGTCEYTKCIPNEVAPNGQECEDLSFTNVNVDFCESIIGDWTQESPPQGADLLSGSVVINSSFESTQKWPGSTPEEAFIEQNCLQNPNRYEPSSTGVPANSTEFRLSTDGCAKAVISNARGLLQNCKRESQMGTLIEHWEYGTPIKTCLLPKNWTAEDTKKFIEDHWEFGLSWNADRGPKTVPGYQQTSGFAPRSLQYAPKSSSNQTLGVILKKVGSYQNGNYVEICTPIFAFDADLSNLPDCD
jgi:hypothetical protein